MQLIDQIDRIPASEANRSAGAGLARVRKVWRELYSSALRRASVLATVLTSFAIFGVVAVQGIILARLLGPEARGEFGTAVFYTYALSTIGLMGTQFAVARRAANDPSGRIQLAQSVPWLGLITGAGTILLVGLLAFTTLPAQKQYLALLCALCALAQPLEHIRLLLLAVDQGSGEFRRYNIVALATSAVFPLALLVMWAAGATSMYVAALLSMVAAPVGLALRLFLSDSPLRWLSAPSPRPTTLLAEGCPYWVSAAVCDLYSRLDQFLFLWMASFLTQGQYAAAVPAAGLMLVGADALAMFSFNAGSRRNEILSRGQFLRLGAMIAVFQAVIAAAFACVVGPLILLLYGDEFAGAVPFALALIPAQAVHGLARVIEGYLRGRGRVSIGIWARSAAAIVMVATVLFTFDHLRELSIPLAALVGNVLVLGILGWFAVVWSDGQHDVETRSETQGMAS